MYGLVPTGLDRPLTDISDDTGTRNGCDRVEVLSFEDQSWIGQMYYDAVNKVAKKDTTYEAWIQLRVQRDALLDASDIYFVGDRVFVSSDARTAWKTYRQALRDLPENTQDPTNPTWPQQPAVPEMGVES